MRIVKSNSDDFGYSHWDIWLDPDDFQALVNRKQISTDRFSVQASKIAEWSSVSITVRLQKGVVPQGEACIWEYWDNGECWETGCDNAFILNDGTPGENGMVFCPYCGQRIEEVEG